MAGRYRKIYAIEKLTGEVFRTCIVGCNCLQRLTFDQAEQSQATEDGFQRIREVTGLTDVMDIVHKFLNRDVEHEQLRCTVRESEDHLRQLREEEAGRPRENVLVDAKPETRGLGAEVVECEQLLDDVRRDHDEIQEHLKKSTLLVDSLTRWAQKLRKSLAPIRELPAAHQSSDLPGFFGELVQVVHEFLQSAHAEMPDSRLVKMTNEAQGRVFAAQQKLLGDKEFLRSNCRVTMAVENMAGSPHPASQGERREDEEDEHCTGTVLIEQARCWLQDERIVMEFANERDRLKKEASDKAAELDAKTPKAKVPAVRRR
eukprot:g1575.t1